VASDFAAERGLACCFLSLNDPDGPHTVTVDSRESLVHGYAHDKRRFVTAALREAGRRPALIVALHPHLAPVVALMRLRSRKSLSMVFAHGIEVWQPLGWPRGPALRKATVVMAPSADTAKHLVLDQGLPSEKVRRLAWGLDPEFESLLRDSARFPRPNFFPEGARIILAVGRWDPAEKYKGADTLITALPQVLRSVPNAILVLVGDGGDRARLEQLAGEYGVADRTRFLHGLTYEELFACYAHCDVFALPSSGEGFGLVFLEAMAHGKPVIGGAHGGIPDVVEDGVTGLLVPHGDIDSLSQALESLLTDQALAREMGTRGRERVQATYTFAQFDARLKQVLKDVLN
jgi:glycosyltransferase involved in cell wall biosynthesis